MKNEPRVNLGQSEFQDSFMVAGAEDSPYRKLRKLELHINELTCSIKVNSFKKRKTIIELKKLNKDDEIEAIEIEEIEFALSTSYHVTKDAELRLANFEMLKKKLIDSVPSKYWDLGYENAEFSHWVNFFSKKVALEKLVTGTVSIATLEQILVLPNEMVSKIMALAPIKEIDYIKIANCQSKETPILKQTKN